MAFHAAGCEVPKQSMNCCVLNSSGNFYHLLDGYVTEGANANALFVDKSGTIADPQFKDAANGDFTVGNDNVKDKKAGDPRWF